MTTRRAVPLLLAAALLVSTGCDGASGTAPTEGAGRESGDDWGEDVPPPTRAEILAAPAEHSADAVAQALVEVAEEADAGALPRVLALTTDEREEIRWHAVVALKAIGGDEAHAALERVAEEDSSAMVRDEAAQR